MDIAFIDNIAYKRTSPFHKASVISKLFLSALIIATVVISANPWVLLFSLLALMAIMYFSQLPVRQLLAFAGYALFFSLIFALSSFSGSFLVTVVVVEKALLAAVSLIMLVSTTPYIEIFSALQVIMPRLLVDMMFSTYRSFFILIQVVSNFFTTLRIRGGYNKFNVARNIKGIARMMGHTFVHAWDMSERVERIMTIRGYESGMLSRSRVSHVNKYDILPLVTGMAILALAVYAG